jgi:hypothetical protein
MGICIALRTETGNDLEFIPDDRNVLHSFLPQPCTDSDSMLGSIDWYGNTIFNRVQMKRFLEEWDHLAERSGTPEQRDLLASVRKLALRCQDELHSYLWFIGD